MSTEITEIEKSGPDEISLGVTQFSSKKGIALQLTQGFGGAVAMVPLNKDEPGYIQLTVKDVKQLIEIFRDWIEHIPEDWYFTFGSGQKHENCFTVIHGTYDSARKEMVERYGLNYSMQYSEREGPDVRKFQHGGEI